MLSYARRLVRKATTRRETVRRKAPRLQLEALGVRIVPAYTVTSTADAGTGTLREAIDAIGAGTDTVYLDTTMMGGDTITLASQIEIKGNVTIENQNPVSAPVWVSGDNQTRLFELVGDDLEVVMRGFTLMYGQVDDTDESGGLIYSEGFNSLQLISSNLSFGSADANGGCIAFVGGGSISLDSTLVQAGSANLGNGGCIYFVGGDSRSFQMQESVISGGFATHAKGGHGGGLFISGGASVLIEDSLFTSNWRSLAVVQSTSKVTAKAMCLCRTRQSPRTK